MDHWIDFIDENEVDFWYLARANNTSQWICAFYLKYIVVSEFVVVTTSFMSVLYCYLTQGSLIGDFFYRPGKFVYVAEIQFLLN